MKIGMVGLGRMGGGIAARLRDKGHEVAGYDADASRSDVASIDALVATLAPPRIVWLMLPADEATQTTVDALATLLSSGDVVIDGGNAHYSDSQRRAARLAENGIDFLDAGVSGGIWGRESGYCLMVGGSEPVYRAVEPLFAALAEPGGYARVGDSGAGHFVKMVHNGIEYGLLQAYAEGFSLLHASEFEYDLPALTALWQKGSVA